MPAVLQDSERIWILLTFIILFWELIGHETKKEETKILRREQRKLLYLRMKKGRCSGMKDETKILGKNERNERMKERNKEMLL